MISHTIDEFFSVGKYLIMGALIASAMQTYIKTSTLVSIGHGQYSAILLMMVLAFILSICSSADAFIAHHLEVLSELVRLSPFLFLVRSLI